MQISEKEEDEVEKRDPSDNWEEGGGGGGGGVEKSSGPWNKTASTSCSSGCYRNPGTDND